MKIGSKNLVVSVANSKLFIRYFFVKFKVSPHFVRLGPHPHQDPGTH